MSKIKTGDNVDYCSGEFNQPAGVVSADLQVIRVLTLAGIKLFNPIPQDGKYYGLENKNHWIIKKDEA